MTRRKVPLLNCIRGLQAGNGLLIRTSSPGTRCSRVVAVLDLLVRNFIALLRGLDEEPLIVIWILCNRVDLLIFQVPENICRFFKLLQYRDASLLGLSFFLFYRNFFFCVWFYVCQKQAVCFLVPKRKRAIVWVERNPVISWFVFSPVLSNWVRHDLALTR